jgi:Protein of unknown function (DUF664)
LMPASLRDQVTARAWRCWAGPASAGPVDPGADDAGSDVAGLDLKGELTWRTEPVTLRWMLFHLIEETARHNGHIDILREMADGVTGR